MFYIDSRSRVPLYQQIVENVERLAAGGVLAPDSRLPSVRALAVELSLNPNTVSRAYSELENKGVIYSLPGRGNFVSANPEVLRRQAIEQQKKQLAEICRAHEPLEAGLESWLELCRTVWQEEQVQQGAASAENTQTHPEEKKGV